ncbi:3-oxoadipate enol-lactonase [Hyphomicrobiales bacterium]|nr:3-oxoadipate enol-lactonase [Hyphomicrobiales bacterium]CAH1690652.1 3-oxoadipate enol-lactonase [Hyphomicrobiales bacterium]
MGAEMTNAVRWADVNGAALRYRIDGASGPWLVLIHEMGGVIESWDLVVPQLDKEFRILRFDTRGAGMSEKIIGDTISLDDLADDLAALLDRLGIHEPVTVAGCAVGAGVALNFAARHAARTAAAVIMNPAIGITDENRPALLTRADALESLGTRGVVEQSLSLGYPEAFRAADPEHFALFKARWLANDPVSLRALFLMLARMDLSPLLPAVLCPVLGISGRHDPLRPTAYVRDVLSKMRDTRLVVTEAGHHMADQAPVPVAQAILDFMAEIRRSGAVA